MNSNTFQKLVDDKLLQQEKEKESRERSGKWNPSSFGRCYRYQFWNRKNERPSNPLNVQTLRTFQAGRLFHDFIQRLLPEHNHEVKVEYKDCVLGYADIVLPEEVVDIKSIRTWGLKALLKCKTMAEVVKDKYCYILQLMAYATILSKPRGRLVFFDKDSLQIVEYEFLTKDWQYLVELEIEKLNKFWEKDLLPPAIPRAYNGKECNYCIFKDKCDAIEKPFGLKGDNDESKPKSKSRKAKSKKPQDMPTDESDGNVMSK